MPACLDYNHNHYTPLKNDIGYIAGFGITNDCFDCFSNPDSLHYSSASIMSFSDCFDTLQTKDYTTFFRLNSDSFCVGNGTVSPVTKGDGGGGITVIHQGLHYLAGVASFKLFKTGSELIYSIGAATNVTLYMDWIKTNLPVDD